jgi:N-methylhydantoinase A
MDPRLRADDVAGAVRGGRRVWFRCGWAETPVMSRDALPLGARFSGPAILEQMDTTIVVEPDMEVEVDAVGNLLIHVPPAFRG